MMGFLLIGLIVLAIPFVAPLVSLYRISRLRGRIDELEREVETQRDTIGQLNARVYSLTRESGSAATAPPPAAAPAVTAPPPAPKPAAVVPTPPPVPTLKPPPPRPSSPPTERPRTEPRVERPSTALGTGPSTSLGTGPAAAVPVTPRTPADPPPMPPVPPPSETDSSGFDWESLVGVKLFSAIAGIALLLAAVFFLRYSVEHGWLQPPVRVGIGIIVAIALLAACELSAARNYPLTANAMDASAIAILFATFFAAHALWNLIPGVVAFALLALVTAVAVALSIRRESLFIAVLGLLGGFATPALLSTGENQPIPLFAYLLLLNIGLAWVAFRQKWPALGWMTVILTAVYQWGWVFRFLTAGQLSLAMGVFLLFPLVSVSGLLVSRRTGDDSFERSALTAAVLPLLFAVYVAAVPGYGGHPWLLLSFLLILDAGLTAIAIARRQDLLFGAAGAATLAVMATLLWTSYGEPARYAVIVFTAAFVLLFAFAPAIADRFDRGFDDPGAYAVYCRAAAPLRLHGHPADRSRLRGAVASARGPARARDRDRVACGNDRRRRAVLHRSVLRDCGAGQLVGDVAGRHTPADRGRDLRAVRAGRARRAAACPTQRTCAQARVRRRHRPHRQPAAAALPRRRFGRAGSCLGARAAARDPERGTLHRGRRDRAAARIARWIHAVVDRPGGVVVARRRQCRRACIADGADRDDAADARRLRLGAATGDGPVDVRRDRGRVQQRPVPRPRGTRLSAVDGVQPRLVGPAVAAVRHADGPHPRLECRLAGDRRRDAASRRGDCRRPRGGRVDLQRRRGLGSRRGRGVDDGQRVRDRLAHGGVTPGSAGACGSERRLRSSSWANAR